MKSKIIIASLIGAILIIGLVFGGVLNYYGKIVGYIYVGPMFYANLVSSNWYDTHQLLLNQKPSSTKEVSFYDGQQVLFESSEINQTFNYQPTCNFQVKVKGNANKNVILKCRYIDSNDNIQEICSTTITLDSNDWEIKSGSCTNSNIPQLQLKKLQLVITGSAAINYSIETNPNGDTYLQITKV